MLRTIGTQLTPEERQNIEDNIKGLISDSNDSASSIRLRQGRPGREGGGDRDHKPAVLRMVQVIPNPRLCKALIERLTGQAYIITTGVDFIGPAGPQHSARRR